MDIVLRAILAFVFIFVLLRVLGRRELSTMEPFDLILLVVVGDLVQQGVTQADTSVTRIGLEEITCWLDAYAIRLADVEVWEATAVDRLEGEGWRIEPVGDVDAGLDALCRIADRPVRPPR